MNEQINILFVEDSDNDFELITQLLKSKGVDHMSTRVQTEEEFTEKLGLNPSVSPGIKKKPWDIIISDYRLPQFNGIRAPEIVKKNNIKVPFIIVSGSIGEDLAVEIMRLGANDFLLKDRLAQIAHTVKREVNSSRLMRRYQEMEAELNSMQEQVQHLQKIEAMGLLANGIAHDFNNLLTIMGMAIQRINSIEHPELQKNVARLSKAHEQGIRLTQQILFFSKRQSAGLEVISINAIINDISELLENIVGRGIQIENKLSESLDKIFINRCQITQIIMNLAINARDAMQYHGKLIFKTENVKLSDSKTIRNTTLMPGKYVRMDVTDCGTGISDNIIEKIFDPFFSTKPKEKGSGLGLSIINGIVHQFQGAIEVQSRVSEGTTFSVYFPTANFSLGGNEKAA